MFCRICGSRLRCQDSRSVNKYTKIRQMACVKCDKVFLAMAILEKEPSQYKVHRQIKERYGNG